MPKIKTIPLSKGKFSKVDDQWFDYLNQWKWYFSPTGYAARTEFVNGKRTGKTILMHRVIANIPEDKFTDHINFDKLDNRRCNLRMCNKSQSEQHKHLQSNNTSGFKGVGWDKRLSKWRSYIMINARQIYLGSFKEIKKAALAYNKAAILYFGNFAKLNIIEQETK